MGRLVVFVFVLFTSLFVNANDSSKHANSEILYFDLGIEGRWVPYQRGANSGSYGVFKEVTDAIAKHANLTFDHVYFPAKRAQKALIDGLIDFEFISLAWLKGSQPGEDFVVSQPIFEVQEYIVTLEGNGENFEKPHSYYDHAVGTIDGYFYHDDDKFKRHDFSTESELIQALGKGRVRVAILEKETAKFWASVHGVSLEFTSLHSRGDLLIRLRNEKQQFMPLINFGITKIKQSGELAKILSSHDIDPAVIH
ncbi:transporter substrate-binding domain-containing protein [Aestuariibacter sp. AA17]|uniref:Transporter substrate-binding domain-containing protein n=1 Tax=Fluctibacter corallii TaxID=2984329 RepID=A0ABT3A9X7_9ALTE|nr:transporter substrate-binding domain-containing protein [Aestuariibacter sp. AA17]MCV2885121.1 transporter substrate-binding domain-containing protein [Aestuariibacter sp. AA17]